MSLKSNLDIGINAQPLLHFVANFEDGFSLLGVAEPQGDLVTLVPDVHHSSVHNLAISVKGFACT